MFQNLFHHHVGFFTHQGTQVLQVTGGIEQAVHVVYPQPLHQTGIHPLLDLLVIVGKHLGALRVQANQVVHGEEAPVVNHLLGGFPVHQPVVLFFQ